MASYHIGDTITLSCTFKNASAVNTDPTTISLTIQDPSGNDATYTYALAQLTRSAAGIYTYDLAVDEQGVWEYRWVGTGTVGQADQGSLTVIPQNV